AAFPCARPSPSQVGVSFSCDANSPDEAQSGLTYSLDGAPAGATINGQGVISWTPTAEQGVPQQFQVVLPDVAANTTTQTVNLTVLAAIPALSDTYAIAE